jgi:hypothetical protein
MRALPWAILFRPFRARTERVALGYPVGPRQGRDGWPGQRLRAPVGKAPRTRRTLRFATRGLRGVRKQVGNLFPACA